MSKHINEYSHAEILEMKTCWGKIECLGCPNMGFNFSPSYCFANLKEKIKSMMPEEQSCATCTDNIVAERVVCGYCSLNPKIKNHYKKRETIEVIRYLWVEMREDLSLTVGNMYYSEDEAKEHKSRLQKIDSTRKVYHETKRDRGSDTARQK